MLKKILKKPTAVYTAVQVPQVLTQLATSEIGLTNLEAKKRLAVLDQVQPACLVRVLRDGFLRELNSHSIVAGDILMLMADETVPTPVLLMSDATVLAAGQASPTAGLGVVLAPNTVSKVDLAPVSMLQTLFGGVSLFALSLGLLAINQLSFISLMVLLGLLMARQLLARLDLTPLRLVFNAFNRLKQAKAALLTRFFKQVEQQLTTTMGARSFNIHAGNAEVPEPI